MKLFVFLLLSSVAFSQNATLIVYKQEKIMEIWEKDSLIKTYEVCSMSGKLGPKRTQGDIQVPEGIYKVILFNPKSNYLLSFKINYPNKSDKLLGRKPFGGDIFFHGRCVSAGCISFLDSDILEIYPKVKSYKKVDVLIFPTKKENYSKLYENMNHNKFWKSLELVLDFWNKHHVVPNWTVDFEGYYLVR